MPALPVKEPSLIPAGLRTILRTDGAPKRSLRIGGVVMPYTRNRIFDDIAKLMTDAAGAAQGVRRDVETVIRSQVERLLREFDVPTREELEAVKDMARLAREENELLKERLAAMEGRAASPKTPGVDLPGGL
jgi:BMFP domain-containing protein YqiC